MTVLVAGVGNTLRGDDGFGVAVAARLIEQGGVPSGVRVLDIGIGGIHLVQELTAGAGGLVVIDAVDRGRAPGTVLVLRPHVRDVTVLPLAQRRDELADMHYATPERAFMLASALGVLPPETWIVGCQPADADRLGEGLSAPVAAAVDVAATEVRRLVSTLGVAWA
ncbi:MAG: hydrogenase maturation protease [Pseudonocardiaceae bacterium]